MFIGLIQRVRHCDFLYFMFRSNGNLLQYGLDNEVAKHLSDSYGDRAWTVCDLAEQYDETDEGGWPLHGKRLCDLYPCGYFPAFSLFLRLITYDCRYRGRSSLCS